jgi:hypothetical protein
MKGSYIFILYLPGPAHYHLLSPGSLSHLTGGTVIVSCTTWPSGSLEAGAPGNQPSSSNSQPVGLLATPSDITAAQPEQEQTLLESFVHTAAQSSGISTPSGIGASGTATQVVSVTISSDSFDTVMGLLKKFVQIGDAIAEVSRSPFRDD